MKSKQEVREIFLRHAKEITKKQKEQETLATTWEGKYIAMCNSDDRKELFWNMYNTYGFTHGLGKVFARTKKYIVSNVKIDEKQVVSSINNAKSKDEQMKAIQNTFMIYVNQNILKGISELMMRNGWTWDKLVSKWAERPERNVYQLLGCPCK